MRRLVVIALAAVAALVGTPPAGAAADTALQTRLARQLSAAGGGTGAQVVDLSDDRILFASRATTTRIPASVEKLPVTASALLRLGPQETLQTVILGDGTLTPDGTYEGDLYLKGFGDPTFGTDRFVHARGGGGRVAILARRLAEAGVIRVVGRLFADDTWFDRRRGVPSSGFRPSGEVGGVLSGLSFNRGLAGGFGADPAASAARALVEEARRERIRDLRADGRRAAPDDAVALAKVDSPSIARLAQLTNRPSDNFLAEMLIKGLGARFADVGSTAAGARVVRGQMRQLGVGWRVVDGSGLARANRVSPSGVTRFLALMRGGVVADEFVESLAVAGQSGTIARRMRGTAAAGRCRGKTGTLRGVSNLAGYCEARNGHTLAFAFLMNRVNPFSARRVQDRMAITLARWGG